MITIKPIQATPELSGEDAKRVIAQVHQRPTSEALKWNEMLRNVFAEVRK